MTGKPGKAHHGAHHARVSATIRAHAYANPDTRCWRCHRTLAELPPHKTGRRPWWTGGHLEDGKVGGDELAECSHCASRTGAERGNRMREPRSEDWYGDAS